MRGVIGAVDTVSVYLPRERSGSGRGGSVNRVCAVGSSKGETVHYRNGREAKNGDKIVRLEGGKVVSFGVLYNATPGSDYCNGNIAVIQPPIDYACMCDCLHVDDVDAILTEKGLGSRPAGK